MTEETKDKEAVVADKVVDEVVIVEPSPTEVSARTQGWVTKEEWEASGRPVDDWRPAKEFVDRGELFKSIHSTKRELKQTQQALDALQRHHQYVFEKAHAQALKDLKDERRLALRNEDLDRVEAIEDEIEARNQQFQKERPVPVPVVASGPPVEFTNWVSANSWYESDADLRDFADAAGLVYVNKHPEARNNPMVVLQHVEKEIRQKFPEKFGTVKKAAPNAVASVDRQAARAKGSDIQLDEMEMDIMRTFVRSGIMTEAEYKAELKKTRGA